MLLSDAGIAREEWTGEGGYALGNAELAELLLRKGVDPPAKYIHAPRSALEDDELGGEVSSDSDYSLDEKVSTHRQTIASLGRKGKETEKKGPGEDADLSDDSGTEITAYREDDTCSSEEKMGEKTRAPKKKPPTKKTENIRNESNNTAAGIRVGDINENIRVQMKERALKLAKEAEAAAAARAKEAKAAASARREKKHQADKQKMKNLHDEVRTEGNSKSGHKV